MSFIDGILKSVDAYVNDWHKNYYFHIAIAVIVLGAIYLVFFK